MADLPDGVETPRYNLIAAETDRERRAVERAVRPTVTALYVLAAASAAVTVVLALLAVSRELRRTRPDQRQWHLLGVSPPQRAAVATSPLVLATAGGGIVGLATAWLLGLGPVGLVEVLERGSSRSLSGRAIWSVGGLVAGVVVAAVAIAVRSARRTDDLRSTATRRQGALATLTASTRPVLADGLRAAYSQRSATPVIGGCATLVGAFVAALVFGSSLTGLLAAPASYGWPWDVARVTGFGYGGLDLDGAAALDDDPAVGSWAALGLINDVVLNGEPTLTLVAFDRRSEVDLTLLAGQMPVRPDEVAVGATSAADRGLRVGDTVELGGVVPQRRATVTGLVVFPALGAFEAERLGAGVGLLVSESALGDTFGSELIASVAGVDLESGTASSRARVQGLLAPLDMWGFPEVSLARPVRPPEVIGAASTQDVPTAVAGVFAAVTAIGVGFASWASVRSRRRDLAVIQALGGQRRQVRRSIRVQSLATMLASLALGVPAGVIAGRVLWRGFARQLGVVPDAGQPWGPVLLTVVGALGLALLAAVVPGFLASRATPAASLRTE